MADDRNRITNALTAKLTAIGIVIARIVYVIYTGEARENPKTLVIGFGLLAIVSAVAFRTTLIPPCKRFLSLTGRLIVWIGIPLGVLYFLVRFVKWAWTD